MRALSGLAVIAVLLASAPARASTPDKLLAQGRSAYEALDYDRVVPLMRELLKAQDLPAATQVEAYRLLGSSLAIVADPSQAEPPFRLLLRLQSTYDMPANTPPKIMGVFRKVQAEERALADQVAMLQRKKLMESLKLLGEPPQSAHGGYPLAFAFRLHDPTGAVDGVRLDYRRKGQAQYASLPLEHDPSGDWRATLPGELTTSPDGFTLEYFVEGHDGRGPLVARGTAEQPLGLDISAGETVRTRPPPVPRWAFFTGAGATAVLGAAAGLSALQLKSARSDYSALIAQSQVQSVSSQQFTDLSARGARDARNTNVLLVGAGVAALATAVMIPFVNWQGVEVP